MDLGLIVCLLLELEHGGGINGKPVSLHRGDDGQQAAFQLEDGLEFERLVFAARVDLSGVQVSHVVLGVCDLLFGEDHAAPITRPKALVDFDFR